MVHWDWVSILFLLDSSDFYWQNPYSDYERFLFLGLILLCSMIHFLMRVIYEKIKNSKFAHSIEEYFWRQKSLFFLALLPFLGYLLLANIGSIFGLIFVFLFYFARWFGSVVLHDYVNVLVVSQMRATVLSIQALVMRAIFAIVGPFIGWISDTYSLKTALLSSGVIFLFLSCISIILLWRNKVLYR